ncbi:MAG: GspE/PulE family protein [Defluviitaleaceae bacterium]|nr:GspE/PulE family protein [Defluviitaleaceae bacterium]
MKYLEDEKLYSILVKENLINLDKKSEQGISFIDFLLKEKLIKIRDLKLILKNHFSINSVDLTEIVINSECLKVINKNIAIKYNIFCFHFSDTIIHIASANPFDHQAFTDVSIMTDKKVIVFFCDSLQVSLFIENYYITSTEDTKNTNNDDVSSVLNSFLQSAITQNASDIHIEPTENIVNIRFRIDGSLKFYQTLEQYAYLNLVSYIKILSDLDISESKFPKDSSFTIDIFKVDFRVSILPTIFGEKIVIRLIYKEGFDFSLEKNNLNFENEELEIIKKMLNSKKGAILVTGPTGSGKTTTLASFISYINKGDVNIVTVEDPVENIIKGVTHVNINTKIDLSFGKLLKHILRQDPDIIMIGEIRDTETAEIVVRAAITGHLVLSTLHTNDAIGTISRFLDMGVPKYLLVESLNGIISQRLLRKLCDNCKIKIKTPMWILEKYNITQDFIYTDNGCSKCFGTGFKGRFAIYEILSITENIKIRILDNTLKDYTDKNMVSIEKKAISYLLLGSTSLKEVYPLLQKDFFS